MSSNINENINDFNSVTKQFMEELSLICPNSIITSNIDLIDKILQKHKTAIIDQFALHILDYKDQLDNKNEDFFISNTFSDKTQDNKTLIGLILELKTIWKSLSDNNKNKIFEYLQVLCYYAREYVLYITSDT